MRSIALVVGMTISAQLPSGVATVGSGDIGLKIAANDVVPSDTNGVTGIGRCGVYVAIDGLATIERVGETPASTAQETSGGGPGYAGYEVKFSFNPDESVSDAETAAWIAKEHELRLANSWFPGPAFVKKYGLETGKTIPAVLEVQKAGPCAPFVFRFPSVDTTDYFETSQ